MMDILEAISRRKSVRSFRPDTVTAEELEAVRRAGEQAEALTGADLQFHLCASDLVQGEVRGVLGDYGKVISAPHYVVLTAHESEGYLVDAGYRFEQLILEATRRGLGTCWVGGWFRESSLRATLGIDESRRVLALTPIGFSPERSLINSALRGAIRASKRKPLQELFFWERHGAPLPQSVLRDTRLVRILEATRWAPSWANKQPWRFVLTGTEVLCYKQAQQVKEGKDYHFVDCGIAMAHLHLAATALGMSGAWELGGFEVPGAADAHPIGRHPLPAAPGLRRSAG
jgi:nitroreductase